MNIVHISGDLFKRRERSGPVSYCGHEDFLGLMQLVLWTSNWGETESKTTPRTLKVAVGSNTLSEIRRNVCHLCLSQSVQ